MMNLYLDLDGVILGKDRNGKVALAAHADEFVDFILANFVVYWLTTHCDGDTGPVLEYLERYASPDLLTKLATIKPTTYIICKTEALHGDFIWIEDSPMRAEMKELVKLGMTSRWIEVNTRLRPDDLLHAITELKLVLEMD